jgi:hypothetical protein
MKKILSVVIALTMICAMLVPMSISASAAEANTLLKSYADAKDGDKLIDLLFGQTTGAYQPRLFANGNGSSTKGSMYMGSPYVNVASDAKSVEMVFSREGEPAETADKDVFGNFLYGGKIDGLKAGTAADGSTYKYTFTFSALFNHTATTNGNTGFYFTMHENLIENTTDDGILYINKGDSDEHLGAYGWYGHPYKQNGETQMRYHVIRNEGQSAKNGGNCNSKISADYKAAMKAGAGEWYDIVIEIDGYKMNAYFNGLELGKGDSLGMFDMTEEMTASNGPTSDLAFIGRMYNCLNTVSIKDVAVYKGIGLNLSQEGGDDTGADTDNNTTAPETTPSKPSMVYNKLNVALWTNVGGVSEANKLNAEQVAKIKEGFEKVLVDAGYNLSKVTINWVDLCADGGHGVEALVPLTNDGDFDVVLGAGTNAITKGLTAVELAPMVVENTKRQAVLIDENNAMANILYEYVTTGKTTGYPAPETGDNTLVVFFAIIAVVALGGTVVASKKKFN